jgi:putative ABC transport system ATP-binding protein
VTGASGSGKSTLLNLISGIDRPTGGSVSVCGTALGHLSEGALADFRGRHIGIVFQFFELIQSLTALENVILPMDLVGAIPRRERRDRAMGLLESLGMEPHAKKVPSRLSGGEQQRVAIARALANDPQILIADEPTGNLDHENSRRINEQFTRLAAEGRTVVIATHDTRDLSRYSRVLKIEDGRLLADRVEVPA